jgi:hypothetical protein
MLLVSQGTSSSVNEAETEAQITSQTNLETGICALNNLTVMVKRLKDPTIYGLEHAQKTRLYCGGQ